MCVQEPIVVFTMPYTGVASRNRTSSGAKRLRTSSGSRDGTKSSMIPNHRLLNGNRTVI